MGKHIINACKKYLPFDGCRVLDPFAGIGTTSKSLPFHHVVGIELEREWADQCSTTICGDSAEIIPTLGMFDAILTSPAYGNRMADDFVATSTTGRSTYRHKLGRPLSDGTTANLYFGRKNRKYEELHEKIWTLCVNALNKDGVFILNCKDFINNNVRHNVTDWHVNYLIGLGLTLIASEKVPSPGMRYGANHSSRIDYENVVCLKKG